MNSEPNSESNSKPNSKLNSKPRSKNIRYPLDYEACVQITNEAREEVRKRNEAGEFVKFVDTYRLRRDMCVEELLKEMSKEYNVDVGPKNVYLVMDYKGHIFVEFYSEATKDELDNEIAKTITRKEEERIAEFAEFQRLAKKFANDQGIK